MHINERLLEETHRDREHLRRRGIPCPRLCDFACDYNAYAAAIRELMDDVIEREIAAEERDEKSWLAYLKDAVISDQAIHRVNVYAQRVNRAKGITYELVPVA